MMRDSSLPKPNRRWYQFSLRTLLVFVLLASLGASWLAVRLHHARRQRDAVIAIRAAGGTVGYDYEVDKTNMFIVQEAEPPAPPWLEWLFGDDFFADVVLVDVYEPDFGDADVEHLKDLTELRSLQLSSTQVTDAGLEHLKGLANLTDLRLHHTQVTDAGLEHLRGLTKLKALYIPFTRVTSKGVERLQRALPNCEIYHSTWAIDLGQRRSASTAEP
jgi:hypothetical protein